MLRVLFEKKFCYRRNDANGEIYNTEICLWTGRQKFCHYICNLKKSEEIIKGLLTLFLNCLKILYDCYINSDEKCANIFFKLKPRKI